MFNLIITPDLSSFKSISNAVSCALNLQDKLKYVIPKFEKSFKTVKIGLSAGSPVEEKNKLFEDAITLSKVLCQFIDSPISMSHEVGLSHEVRVFNDNLKNGLIRILKLSDEVLIKDFIAYIEEIWNDPQISIQSFSKQLGYSQSQLYRKIRALTGKSPVQFLSDYKLDKAIELIHKKEGNISEIAFDCGFNSAFDFSKCFIKNMIYFLLTIC